MVEKIMYKFTQKSFVCKAAKLDQKVKKNPYKQPGKN